MGVKPHMDSLLLLRCPTCGHNGAHVYICSNTVLTVRCARCAHDWCLDVRSLAPAMQSQLEAVLNAN